MGLVKGGMEAVGPGVRRAEFSGGGHWRSAAARVGTAGRYVLFREFCIIGHGMNRRVRGLECGGSDVVHCEGHRRGARRLWVVGVDGGLNF